MIIGELIDKYQDRLNKAKSSVKYMDDTGDPAGVIFWLAKSSEREQILEDLWKLRDGQPEVASPLGYRPVNYLIERRRNDYRRSAEVDQSIC